MFHVPFIDIAPLNERKDTLAALAVKAAPGFGLSLTALPSGAPADPSRFDYLFSDLQNPDDLLPESSDTVTALIDLGSTMIDASPDGASSSEIPSLYTYFSQFIDHDLTLMTMPRSFVLDPSTLKPLRVDVLRDSVRNVRTPALDLDSVYSVAPQSGDNLLLGRVTKSDFPVPGKDVFNDVPRERPSIDPTHDRTARIGDARNEENIIISQLHLAFLRAHNAIVARGLNFCEARRVLRQHYQWIIIHDYLKRLVEPSLVDEILSDPCKIYVPRLTDFFMPLEFSGAAFRFGHTMVRPAYDYNSVLKTLSFRRLLSPLADYDSLSASWVIEWERFVEGGTNKAQSIDTLLAGPLSVLPGPPGGGAPSRVNLAIQDLLRGYQLRLPTGQAVARALGLTDEDVLTDKEIEAIGDSIQGGAQGQVLGQLRGTGSAQWKLSERTPLWFYVLAEAAHFNKGQQEQRLGPVGSRLVAGVLIGLIRRTRDSFLQVPGWTPTLGTSGSFGLSDLLRLAGTLS